MEPKKYRITQHQSELAVRVVGDSQADLFSNSGFALFDVMVPDLEKVEAREKLPLEVGGTDRDDLMVIGVRGLLCVCQGSGYLLREFHVREAKDTLVKAEVSGEKIDPDRHESRQEIAAVAFHKSRMQKT